MKGKRLLKTELVWSRVTPLQRAEIERQAIERQMSISEYIREKVVYADQRSQRTEAKG